MREIKFRGINKIDGGWVYGLLVDIDKRLEQGQIDSFDNELGYTGFIVDLNTVGQFTGLYDKNGKEIYEGDIVRWQYPCRDSDTGWYGWSAPSLCEVKFEYGAFYINEYPYVLGKTLDFDDGEDWRLEVIGNIHDKEQKDEQ